MVDSNQLDMLVAACAADGSIRLERRPIPHPRSGEVVLALRWCGLCGTDLFKLANRLVADGVVLGHELVGTLTSVADDVADFSIGDRVVVPHHVACGSCELCRRGADTQCPTFQENLLSPGGFSERILIGSRAVRRAMRRLPDRISSAGATFLEPAACVLRGIDKAQLPEGEGTALVIGGGGMGLLHLLVLRAFNPGVAVIVCDLLEARRDLARRLGAAAGCTPNELSETVAGLTGRWGVDAVFDTVGGSRPLADGLRATRPGGVVVLFAHAAAGEAAGFELNPFFKGERRVVASYSGGLGEQERVAAALFDGRLDPAPLISHRMPIDQLGRGVTMAREHRALKILIGPGDGGRD